jgi:Short C-terminal domain
MRVAHPAFAEGDGMAFEELGPVDYAIVAGETLFNEEDVMNAAPALDPGSSAAMIVWENLVVTQLRQLAELAQQGILTEQEFAAKKAQLLGI